MVTSTEVDKILSKLFKVKSKLESVKKTAKNPFFKSNYADLPAHLELVEPLLQEEGLVLLQPTEVNPILGNSMATSVIYDKDSGQFVKSVMNLVGETDMQKSGAAVTYGRRFTLNALLGMISEDDDGETAVGRGGKTKSIGSSGPQKTVSASTSEGSASNNATKPRASFKKQATVNTGDDI